MHDQAWSWVGEDGIEHRGSENQLTDALASGYLAPFVLVTKPEWRDWLPAMTVVELQWALPAGTADNPRRPLPRENLPKLPPPLGDYPIFRQRHQNLLQYAASFPPEMPSSSGRALPKYTSDDYDEPTVQIDAEELERALNESRGNDGTLRRDPSSPFSGLAHTPSPAAGSATGMVSKPLNRAALAQRLAQKMPTHPGYVVNMPPVPQPSAPGAQSQPVSPPAPRSALISSPKSAPLSSHPGPLAFDSRRPPPVAPPSQVPPPPVAPPSQVPPLYRPTDNTSGFGGHEPTMSSRLDSVLPPPRTGSLGGRRALWLLAFVAVGAVAGAFIFGPQLPTGAPTPAPPPATTANLTAPAATTHTPQVKACVAGNQAKLSDYAHALVRPAAGSVPGSPKVAIAFAQSGKIATGLAMDPTTLAVSPLYSDAQNSPVWSVTPTTVGGALKFQTSRAASTLRSTTTLPTAEPLVIGLNRDHIAGRAASDVVDRPIWKSDWDTISSPDWVQLSAATFALTFRGGGERGKIVVGKLDEAGKPLGPLVPVTSPAPRVEAPFITLSEQQMLVTFAGGDKPLRDKILVAASKRDELPTSARELLTVTEGVTSPQLVPLAEGGLALQYTRGVAGKQQLLVQVFSADLRPVGEPFVVSPPGKDAYEGYAFRHNQQVYVLYFARQTLGHELWITSLVCHGS